MARGARACQEAVVCFQGYEGGEKLNSCHTREASKAQVKHELGLDPLLGLGTLKMPFFFLNRNFI